MRRKNVPCSPCSGGSSSGDCCGLKEKLRILWDRTIGSILRINGISPDGDGDFTIEAGSNIAISERGTGNGIRIDTTGGVSYYKSGDSYVNVDNNDLEISVNVGTGGLAKDDDLQTVAQAVTDILDGTSTVPEATHATSADSATSAGSATNATNAQYLGNNTSNVGTDTKPIKIVNGEAVPVASDLATQTQLPGYYTTAPAGNTYFFVFGKVCVVSIAGPSVSQGSNIEIASGLPTHVNGNVHTFLAGPNGQARGLAYITEQGQVRVTTTEAGAIYGEIVYITNQ